MDSSAGIKAHVNEGYFAQTAMEAAKFVRCPVIVVGGFRSLDTMEHVLNASNIECISLSRPLLRQPDLPEKMRKDPSTISKCISCNACYNTLAHKCIFRKKDLS
jgi:2,4-dienoyl-CoA reductase-like NADH-dependent reductase (Old Yellow Enzyme family)